MLVDELCARQITLEVCPTSNVCTRAVASLVDHPIKRLFEAGVPVTVNSDDPPMFGTTLLDEQLLLVREFAFTIDDIEKINLNGVKAAFLPEADRRRLDTEFRAEYARLRRELTIG